MVSFLELMGKNMNTVQPKATILITEEENDKFSLTNKFIETLNPYPGKYFKGFISKYLKHDIKINNCNKK